MKTKNLLITIFCVIFLFVLTGAVYWGTKGDSYDITDISSPEILHFATTSQGSSLILRNNSTYYEFSQSGETLNTITFGINIIDAVVQDNYIFTYSINESSSDILVTQTKISEPSQVSSYLILENIYNISFISSTTDGTYFVKKDEPTILYFYNTTDEVTYSLDLTNKIEFFQIYENQLILYSNGIMYLDGNLNIQESISSYYIPSMFFTENIFVDTDGTFCEIDTEVTPIISTLYSTDYAFFSECTFQYHYADSQYLYFLMEISTPVKADYSGTILEYYSTDTSVYGLNSTGAILKDSNYTPFSSFTMDKVSTDDTDEEESEDEEVDEEETDSEENNSDDSAEGEDITTPSDTESAEDILDNLKITENYIIFDETTTISIISSKLQTNIYSEGVIVTSGALKTGMTATIDEKEYILVLIGDVNGSGTTNTVDIKLAQYHLIYSELLQDEFLIAGDIS